MFGGKCPTFARDGEVETGFTKCLRRPDEATEMLTSVEQSTCLYWVSGRLHHGLSADWQPRFRGRPSFDHRLLTGAVYYRDYSGPCVSLICIAPRPLFLSSIRSYNFSYNFSVPFFFSGPDRWARSVCDLPVSLSAAYIRNHTSELHQMFCACFLRFSSPVAALQFIMYFWFCGFSIFSILGEPCSTTDAIMYAQSDSPWAARTRKCARRNKQNDTKN